MHNLARRARYHLTNTFVTYFPPQGGVSMDSDVMYREMDEYAEQVTMLLMEKGLVEEEESKHFRRFLRGW